MKKILLILLLLPVFLFGQVYINEIDYDQTSTDTGEFIELVGFDGTDLTGYTIELSTGSTGAIYTTLDLAGQVIPSDNINGYGFFVIAPAGYTNVDWTPDGWVSNAFQNGAPDGILLKHNGTVVDGISYEGDMSTVNSDFTSGMVVSAIDDYDNGEFLNSIGRVTLGFDNTNQNQFFADVSYLPSPGEQNVAHGQDLTGTIDMPAVIADITSGVFDAATSFEISATVTDDNGVTGVELKYYVYSSDTPGATQTLTMTADGDIYSATIDASGTTDGDGVVYWVVATDNATPAANVTTSPENRVLLGATTLAKVRTDDGSDGLLYEGFLAKVQGVINAGSGLYDLGTYEMYMQDGNYGVQLRSYTAITTEYTDSTEIEIIGEIADQYGLARISFEDASSITVLNYNVAYSISDVNTDNINLTSGEPFEGMVVRLWSVDTVSSDEYGKYTMVDGEDGNFYMNLAMNDSFDELPAPGWPVEYLVGVVTYNYGDYVVLPRYVRDIEGWNPVGIEDDFTPITSKFSVEQNYPNPFNPTTEISYTVPTAGKVEFKVFNVLGQEVFAAQINAMAGANNYQFNGTDLSSGLYFYQVKQGVNVLTKKMVLMK